MTAPHKERSQRKVKDPPSEAAKGPGARPWSGSRGETHCRVKGQSPLWVQGKALSEFEAEPHSAQADKRCRQKKRNTNFLLVQSKHRSINLHRFTILQHKVKSAKSAAILRRTNYRHKCVGAGALDSPTLSPDDTFVIRTTKSRGEQRSPAFVRLHGMYKFKPRRSPNGTSGAPSPTWYVKKHKYCADIASEIANKTGERCSPLPMPPIDTPPQSCYNKTKR